MRKKKDLPDVERVKLSPLFGIRPGIIILASIAAAVLLAFFLICMLPGIISGSGYIAFSLPTSDTAIYMDGKYLGSSEGSVYRVPAGRHEFSFMIAGSDAGSIEHDVKGRIFFTLFTHRMETIAFEPVYTPELEKAISDSFAEDAAAWSRVIEYEDPYGFPPLFSHFASNAAALGFDDIRDIWLYGAMHITSRAMYEDYAEGMETLAASSAAYISPELEELDAKLDAIYSGTGLPAPAPGSNAGVEPISSSGGFISYAPCPVSMGRSGSASYPESNEYPASVMAEAFSVASHPVSEYEYALFTEAVPYWSRANKERLIADGMVDDSYLEGVSLSVSAVSTRPVRNISIYAAEAYCRWRSAEEGREYSLPSEAEWYAAALSAADKRYAASLIFYDPDPSSPSGMMGQLWEFTSTPYVPLMRLSDYQKAIELSSLYPYDGHIVKGGSYINSPESITIDSVGVMDKSSCSPFAGFRVRTE